MTAIVAPPAHSHGQSIPCVRGCPRYLHYRMEQTRCVTSLDVTSTTVGWAPEEKPIYICNKLMPCPDHVDSDGARGQRVGAP